MSTSSSFVSVNANSYLSREMYKNGSSPLNMTLVPLSYGFSVPTNKIDSIPIVSYMYYLIANYFSSNFPDSNLIADYQPVLEAAQTAFVPFGDLIAKPSTEPPLSSAESSLRLLASLNIASGQMPPSLPSTKTTIST